MHYTLAPLIACALMMIAAAWLGAKLIAARAELAVADEDRADLREANAALATTGKRLAEAVDAQEGVIREQGRELGEHRANAQRVRQGALRASEAAAAARKGRLADGAGGVVRASAKG